MSDYEDEDFESVDESPVKASDQRRIQATQPSAADDDATPSWLRPTQKKSVTSSGADSSSRNSPHEEPAPPPPPPPQPAPVQSQYNQPARVTRSPSPDSPRSSSVHSRRSTPRSTPRKAVRSRSNSSAGTPPRRYADSDDDSRAHSSSFNSNRTPRQNEKPTSAPLQQKRPATNDTRFSDTTETRKTPLDRGKSWEPDRGNQQDAPTKEIGNLRLKNAELQRAIETIREQLSRIAPKLNHNKKRAVSLENDRANRLQAESAQLQHENNVLQKKLKDVAMVKDIEKQLATKESEVKSLADRNKFLQVEIRNNAKRLKAFAEVEEHRSHVLAEIKQEKKIALNALEKARKDCELATTSKDGVLRRIAALEARDRLPELKAEDVKILIDLQQKLAEKQEAIDALQYRLSVLKRAHDSQQRQQHSVPQDGVVEIDMLKGEIAALKQKLEASAPPEPEAPSGHSTPLNKALEEPTKKAAPATKQPVDKSRQPAKAAAKAPPKVQPSKEKAHVSDDSDVENLVPPALKHTVSADSAKSKDNPKRTTEKDVARERLEAARKEAERQQQEERRQEEARAEKERQEAAVRESQRKEQLKRIAREIDDCDEQEEALREDLRRDQEVARQSILRRAEDEKPMVPTVVKHGRRGVGTPPAEPAVVPLPEVKPANPPAANRRTSGSSVPDWFGAPVQQSAAKTSPPPAPQPVTMEPVVAKKDDVPSWLDD